MTSVHRFLMIIPAIATLMLSAVIAPVVIAEPKDAATKTEGQSAPEPVNEAAKSAMKIQQDAQAVQTELREIQLNTLEANPELKKQGEELQNLIVKTMKDQGATPEKDTAKLQELSQEIQGAGNDKAKQMEMFQEFQQIRQGLMQARSQAMQVEEVKEGSEKFRTDLLAAMEKQNPKTKALMEQMQELQQQQQALIHQQQQPKQDGATK